jgi:uncharacterized membrane protein
MTALGVALGAPELFGRNGDLFVRVAGIVGALFFGVCIVVAIWRLVTADRVVLTLSPEGIRYQSGTSDLRLQASVSEQWQNVGFPFGATAIEA